jgi:transcriptional regulator with XRE-family HTH domain
MSTPNPKDIAIGKRLSELRRSRKISQTALGKNSKISFQQIQKYEWGTNRIAGSRIAEFAEFFQVSASYFFDGLDKNTATHEPTNPQELDLLKYFRAVRPDAQMSILSVAKQTAQISA